ncbi:uncharacterized protein LOC135101401 [Scylla paramamosain]|uniref:uncharacterized protein LOC135101401 n=1 Tax=Scylla paramamosain TaxID=85552 RepID=UPI0030832292
MDDTLYQATHMSAELGIPLLPCPIHETDVGSPWPPRWVHCASSYSSTTLSPAPPIAVDVPINNKDLDYLPLQATLEQLQVWTEENRMTINHSKTVVMHVYLLSGSTSSPALSGLPFSPGGLVNQAVWCHSG